MQHQTVFTAQPDCFLNPKKNVNGDSVPYLFGNSLCKLTFSVRQYIIFGTLLNACHIHVCTAYALYFNRMGIRFPQLRHTTHKMTLSSVRSSQLLGRIAELEIQAEREGQLNRGFPTASSLCSSATPNGELSLLVSLLMCVFVISAVPGYAGQARSSSDNSQAINGAFPLVG